MAGDRCTVSQMADVIMEGLEEYAQLAADDMKKAVKKAGTQARKDIQENAPVKTGAYAKSWAAKTTKETANAMEIVEQVPAGPSAGVRSCAEKRRQDKGISTYCSCGGTGCADSGTGSGEGTEVMAGGESI
mgnify:CR=1 FL=1